MLNKKLIYLLFTRLLYLRVAAEIGDSVFSGERTMTRTDAFGVSQSPCNFTVSGFSKTVRKHENISHSFSFCQPTKSFRYPIRPCSRFFLFFEFKIEFACDFKRSKVFAYIVIRAPFTFVHKVISTFYVLTEKIGVWNAHIWLFKAFIFIRDIDRTPSHIVSMCFLNALNEFVVFERKCKYCINYLLWSFICEKYTRIWSMWNNVERFIYVLKQNSYIW